MLEKSQVLVKVKLVVGVPLDFWDSDLVNMEDSDSFTVI